MTTHVLGAETGQLEALASRLTQTGGEIEQVQTETQSTADIVVAEMEGAFSKALTGIEQSMQQLRATVEAANAQLSDTTWTGANAATFQSGYLEFDGAMKNFEAAVHGAYQDFNGQMRHVGETITRFQTEVTTSMRQAHSSTESMQLAVTQQQANLESAMNTGLSFG